MGEIGWRKLRLKKLKTKKSAAFSLTFTNIWPNRTTKSSALFDVIKPLSLSSTPGLLSCSTRLLSQAASPIWPSDLQHGKAVRHHCNFGGFFFHTTQNRKCLYYRQTLRNHVKFCWYILWDLLFPTMCLFTLLSAFPCQRCECQVFHSTNFHRGYYVSSILGCPKGTPFFIRVARQ